jgi:hypothetical protein
MHRVKPKGEGKNTKRNIRQKEKRMETETKVETDTDKFQQGSAKVNVAADKPAVVEKKESSNILAFKPRNVGQKQRKKKLKL